jgi:hypothetical protein
MHPGNGSRCFTRNYSSQIIKLIILEKNFTIMKKCIEKCNYPVTVKLKKISCVQVTHG